MNGYYWIYIAVAALAFLCNFLPHKAQRQRLYYVGCGLLMMLFVAQDLSVGRDTGEYLLQYGLIQDLPFAKMFTHKFEFGYVLLNRGLGILFPGERILIVAMALIILLPFFHWMDEDSGKPELALVAFVALGIFSHALILYRQLCAMAILTYSVRFVRERKFIPFLLTVLCAMTFHRTAAIFLLVYVAYSVPVTFKWMAVSLGLSVAFGLLGRPLVKLLENFSYSPADMLYDGGVSMLVALWGFALLSWWLMGKKLEDPVWKVPFVMVLLAAVIQPVSFVFANWSRIVIYLRMGMVVLLPELYSIVFEDKENSKPMLLMKQFAPGLYRAADRIYDTKLFRITVQLAMFAVLFVWYMAEVDGYVYSLAPM